MRFKKALLSLISAAVLVFSIGYTPVVTTEVSAAKSAAELKAELEAAKKESNKVKAEIAELEKENAPYVEKKKALQKQIDATQKEIDLYQEQIDFYDAEIAVLQGEIDTINAEIDKNIEIFSERLFVLCTTGSYSELELFLTADDFGDYLEKAQFSQELADNDARMLKRLSDDIASVEEKKGAIDQNRQGIIDSQKAIQEKQLELDRQYAEVNTIVNNYESDIADLQDDLESLRDEEKKIQESLNEVTGNLVGTGQFLWPVPGYYKLSSKFGYRIHPVYGTKRLHTGIDIASSGIYGAKIVASDDGVVSLSGWNGGYGNCVVIKHNNGYSTLYAHMKSASPLRKGQAVRKGDTVGYVGSTGTSTGPHLHFEIRFNNVHKNPMNWFNL